MEEPEDAPTCRICHGGAEDGNPLMSPCRCRGTMAHVHASCLADWQRVSGKRHCDVCRAAYRSPGWRLRAALAHVQAAAFTVGCIGTLCTFVVMYGEERSQERAVRAFLQQHERGAQVQPEHRRILQAHQRRFERASRRYCMWHAGTMGAGVVPGMLRWLRARFP
ncbi:hypothetical protein ABPG75_009241 [Micractinium tetrahymenae]